MPAVFSRSFERAIVKLNYFKQQSQCGEREQVLSTSRSEDLQRSNSPMRQSSKPDVWPWGLDSRTFLLPASTLQHAQLWWYLWTLCGKEKSVLCVPEICNRFVITNTALSGAGLVLQKSRWSLHRQCVKWASNHWEQREGVSTALSNFPAGPTNYKVRTTIVILYSNYLHDKGHHISLNSHLASALQNKIILKHLPEDKNSKQIW